jgi:hypothetical protein
VFASTGAVLTCRCRCDSPRLRLSPTLLVVSIEVAFRDLYGSRSIAFYIWHNCRSRAARCAAHVVDPPALNEEWSTKPGHAIDNFQSIARDYV